MQHTDRQTEHSLSSHILPGYSLQLLYLHYGGIVLCFCVITPTLLHCHPYALSMKPSLPRAAWAQVGLSIQFRQSVCLYVNAYCGPISLGLPEGLSTHGRSQD